MTIPQFNAGHEPLDVAGRFVPRVEFRQDDEDGNSKMSGIPLQLIASASVASHNSALVTFTKAEDDLM